MNKLKIGLIGLGTVGCGVYKTIQNIDNVEIVKIAVKNINKPRSVEVPREMLTDNPYDVVNDPSIDVVVELIGGVEPAYDYISTAIKNGKHIVTANKELLAKRGEELFILSEEYNKVVLYEAAIAGGIPIIMPIKTILAGNKINRIQAILNGTTNYILTKMDQEGASYDEVLKQAQELGYAERNPEADVEGGDACRKIAILTSIVYGKHLDYTKIHTEGITKISTEDFKYADALGVSIKLVGTTKKEGDTLYSFVAPMMLDENHPLSGIHDVFNGIFVHGNVVDDIMFYGRGAGKLPTASAVVSDVVDEVKHMGKNIMASWDAEPLPIGDFRDAVNRFFVRVSADSITKEEVQKLFGDVTYVTAEGIDGELAFITSAMTEGSFADAIAKIDKIYSIIRVAF